MNPRHTPFHPRWHRERTPIFWWLGRWSYVAFIARELTSLAVAYAAVLTVLQVRALTGGVESWARFEAWLRSPGALALHAVLSAALLFHTVTWLNLAPRALRIRLAGRPVPPGAILAGHYGAWAAASALVAWGLLG